MKRWKQKREKKKLRIIDTLARYPQPSCFGGFNPTSCNKMCAHWGECWDKSEKVKT